MGKLTPAQYAKRYLPVMVMASGSAEAYPITVDRYRIGDPPPAKDQLWSAVKAHFASEQRKNRNYRLELIVNRQLVTVSSAQEILRAVVNPFSGKGSPEDVQVALQLAVKLGVVPAGRLQMWADANIGLDCNGFVGNYIYREILDHAWRDAPGDSETGPAADIATIFNNVAGRNHPAALTEVADIDVTRPHVIVRVDASGNVIAGGPEALKAGKVGHIAITEPGQVQNPVIRDPGGPAGPLTVAQHAAAQAQAYGRTAYRTVESAGEKVDGINWGVHENWFTFTSKARNLPKVFHATRDRIRKDDLVKVAPLKQW
jgi:hypothetical protein